MTDGAIHGGVQNQFDKVIQAQNDRSTHKDMTQKLVRAADTITDLKKRVAALEAYITFLEYLRMDCSPAKSDSD